ncbi:MAG TPA: hypothetical protein VE377_08125 [Candidatus Dormibacteraeota bacterium]|nr:hypothetical protein [Candidatus Dormibacteraeota bacterium]
MPQYEPKIDSREFEVANAELESASKASELASDVADITIRIWRREGSEASGALTWDAESVLVYMISDLVVASHGRTASESPAVMTAHFDNARQAMVGARRIQTSILEYLACRPDDYLGAAILVHPPAAAGFTAAVAQSALRLAEPGQIILTAEVSRRFQEAPGVELRNVPGMTTGGSEHAGLCELVWTSPERLAQLRTAAGSGASRNQERPPVGATMIVNAPFGARGATSSTPQPVGVTGSVPASKAQGTGRLPAPPVSDEFKKKRDTSFQEGLADFEERRSFLTRTRLILGVVALVIVGVGIAMFYPSGGTKVPRQNQEPRAVKPASEPAQTTPPPGAQPALESTVKEPAPVTKTAKATAEKHTKDKGLAKEIPPKPPEPEPPQRVEGMTQRDIPRVLQMAKTDAGAGNYGKAQHEYQIVLSLDPGNADAKEGMRKLQVARSENQ